eukprot:scaffold13018_cov65-Cylindrotheca_fusiformis.AAC.3
MDKDDNPYEILGVSLDADEKELKKAYRMLAIKYHPDKQQNKATTSAKNDDDMFSKISDAYDTLTDPVKKYDWTQAHNDATKLRSASSPNGSVRRTGPPPPNNYQRSPQRPPPGPKTVHEINPKKNQLMVNEFGKDYKTKVANEWNTEKSNNNKNTTGG